MWLENDNNLANTFGFLIPLSIIIIAIVATATIFFVGIKEQQARESTPLTNLQQEVQPKEKPPQKRITAALPINRATEKATTTDLKVEKAKDVLAEKIISQLPGLNNTNTLDNSVLIDVRRQRNIIT